MQGHTHTSTHKGHHPISWSTHTGAHCSTYIGEHTHTYTHMHRSRSQSLAHAPPPHQSHTDTHTHIVDGGKNMACCTQTHTWVETVFRHALLLGVCNKDFHGCPLPFPSTAAPAENTHRHTRNYHLINRPTGQTSHQSGQRVINKLMAT